MENTNKKENKIEIVKGAVIGFAVGVIWELMIITPLMSDWTPVSYTHLTLPTILLV